LTEFGVQCLCADREGIPGGAERWAVGEVEIRDLVTLEAAKMAAADVSMRLAQLASPSGTLCRCT
jgi:hypothetical protein